MLTLEITFLKPSGWRAGLPYRLDQKVGFRIIRGDLPGPLAANLEIFEIASLEISNLEIEKSSLLGHRRGAMILKCSGLAGFNY